MKSPNRIVLIALLALLPGCVAAAALGVAAAGAAGAVLYAKNEAIMKYPATLDATWDATMATMTEYGYSVDSSRRPNKTEGRIDADDTVVRVVAIPGDLTQVSIRIGTFRTDDHKRKAKLMLESIKKRLGT